MLLWPVLQMWSHPTAITTIDHLPEQVLVHILHRVQQRERLCCCALVSRAWAAAAAAATTAVAVSRMAPAGVSSFNAMLQQHAQQMTEIRVDGSRGSNGPYVLPAAALVQLHTLIMFVADMQLRPRDGAAPPGWRWQQCTAAQSWIRLR